MKARVQLTDGNASSYIPSIETPALQAAAGGRTGPRHSCSALVPLPVTAHCGLRSNDILAALRSPAMSCKYLRVAAAHWGTTTCSLGPRAHDSGAAIILLQAKGGPHYAALQCLGAG